MKRSVDGVLKVENVTDSNDLLAQVEQEVLECAKEGQLLKEIHIPYQSLKEAKPTQEVMLRIADFAAVHILDTGIVKNNISLTGTN